LIAAATLSRSGDSAASSRVSVTSAVFAALLAILPSLNKLYSCPANAEHQQAFLDTSLPPIIDHPAPWSDPVFTDKTLLLRALAGSLKTLPIFF
jgi:hypothetical protein